MTLKLYIKALYFTVEPARCQDCRIVLPSFLFPVANWNDVTLCRRCLNKLFKNPEDSDYINHFNPIRYFFYSFHNSLDFVKTVEKYPGRRL